MSNTVYTALAPEAAKRNITRIAKIGVKTKALIHKTAVGILLHAKEHGDYTKMIELVDAVAAGTSKSMAKLLVQWVVNYTPLDYVAESKRKNAEGKVEKVAHSFVNSKDKKRSYNDADGAENPYYEMERDEDMRPVDFNKLINSLLQRAFTAREEGKLNEGDKLDAVAAAIGFQPKRELTEEEKAAAAKEAKRAKLLAQIAALDAAEEAVANTEQAVG